MKNILDYLKDNGNIDFIKMPFNKLDGVIFSRLSYIKFDGVITKNRLFKHKLKPTLKLLMNSKDVDKRLKQQDKELVKIILETTRYNNIFLKCYINKFDENKVKQFSATSFLNKEKLCSFAVISFRGTDGTIVGWKEDFNMSYLETIPAQDEASLYVKRIINWLKTDNLFLVGHSKGGNLAIYAAATVKKYSIINKVFVYDSPGFLQKFIESEEFLRIKDKIRCYVPETSIIGRLMNTPYLIKIVESRQKLLYQHNVYNWIYDNNDFSYLSKTSFISNIIDKVIKNNLSHLNYDEKKTFIDELFNLLSEMGESPIQDITNDFFAFAKRFYHRLKSLDEKKRKIITSTFKLFIKSKEKRNELDTF